MTEIVEPHDSSTLPTNTVHAERSPKGEVEACGGGDLSPFDFAALRSGRAGEWLPVGEEVYQSSVVRFSVYTL
jgi:hypothetical protein